MDLRRVIHNNESSFLILKDGVPCYMAQQIPDDSVYYMLSPGNNTLFPVSNFRVNPNTHLIWTMRPGNRTGNMWFGVDNSDDNTDFRIGCPAGWNFSFVDIGSNRGNLYYTIGGSNSDLKMTVEQYNHGVRITDGDTGAAIASADFTKVSSYSYGDVGLFSVPNFKIYDCKIVDDVQGTVFDAVVTADGLYDKVSQQIIPLSGWTVVKEQ